MIYPRRRDRSPDTVSRKTRRAIFAAFAIVAAATLTTPSSGTADTLRVGKAGREAFSFVPVDVGAEVGIFKKHGLDLEISSFGGEARLQQGMAADSVDIGLSSGPGLAFIVKGSPIKGIAAMAGPPLLFALMVRTDDAVKTVADLKGKKVGVSTVGSVTSWIVSEVSRQNGWGFDGVTQVPIGDDASRIAALRTKSLDAAIVNLAVAINFVQRGEGRILLRFHDLLKDFHVHVIFATDKAITARPEALRGFLKGWFETIAFMRANKAETVRITRPIMGTDEATTAAVLSRSFVEMKTLPTEPDMKTLYTEAFLPKQ